MTKAQVSIRPEIELTVDDTASAIFRAAPEGPIFRRAGTLVRPSDDYKSVITWAPEALRVQISRYCNFTDGNRVVQPPKWLSRALLENPPTSLPPLESISRTPLLMDDGSVVSDGYHRDSGTLVRAPAAKSVHADDALEVLMKPFREFPFETPRDRSALLSALLTVYLRHMIQGPIPLFAVSAPAPASGKSLLVQLVANQTTGDSVEALLPVKGEEEMRKRLLSIAIKAPQIVFFDNLVEGLSSESLCSAITGGSICDRVLGSTQMVEASFRAVWFATGNHLQIEGDMRRRTLHINLDPKTDNPHLRRFDVEEGALISNTAAMSAQAAGAAHALVRQFWVEGSPQHGKERLGSFGSWDALVRSMVIWLGQPDPCSNQGPSSEDRLLSEWHRHFGRKAVPAAHIYGHLSRNLPSSALRSVKATGRYLASLEAKGLVTRAHRDGALGQTWRVR